MHLLSHTMPNGYNRLIVLMWSAY